MRSAGRCGRIVDALTAAGDIGIVESAVVIEINPRLKLAASRVIVENAHRDRDAGPRGDVRRHCHAIFISAIRRRCRVWSDTALRIHDGAETDVRVNRAAGSGRGSARSIPITKIKRCRRDDAALENRQMNLDVGGEVIAGNGAFHGARCRINRGIGSENGAVETLAEGQGGGVRKVPENLRPDQRIDEVSGEVSARAVVDRGARAVNQNRGRIVSIQIDVDRLHVAVVEQRVAINGENRHTIGIQCGDI